MSEVKRAKLISFGSQRVNDKSSKEPSKTIRISVILPESTEDQCPEFNYKDELSAAKKKQMLIKNPALKQTNGLDPFNEDDEDVKRIAAEMEAKYGMSVTKKKKWKRDDYADIGMGYDESDSFIDNTDGYDEIIPKNVTAVLGGFYINSGALEFKTDENVSSETSSSEEEEEEEKSFNRKRPLESSAESEDETQTDKSEKEHVEKKPKLLPNTNGMQKAIKKRLFSHDKIKQQIRRKRVDEGKKTVRELLKEKREDLHIPVASEGGGAAAEKPESSLSPPKENQNPPAISASVEDVIESVISATSKMKEENMDESSKDSGSSKDVSINNKSVTNSPETVIHNEPITVKPIEIVQLPENLPADITQIIENIKKAAACSTEGKVKFFSGHVNTMLLNLERRCKCLGRQSRIKVYEHLAPFVKCRKETLIKRANNLVILEEQKKIRSLLDRLKTMVNINMPKVVEKHEEECQAQMKRNQQSWEWYRCAWYSIQNDELRKTLRMPKRYFPWTEEGKKLLREAVTLRKKCFIIERKHKDGLELHLISFLKTEILPIWPEGWMKLNTLMRFCGHTFDVKKTVDPQKKNNSTSSLDISLTASPVAIPITSNSGLTITPVTTSNVVQHKQSSSNDGKIKPKSITLSETTISKINSDNPLSSSNSSVINKPLPPVDIVKTSVPEHNNPKPILSTTPAISITKNEIEIEEHPIKIEDILKIKEPENLSKQIKTEVKKEEPEDLSAHVNLIKSEGTETFSKEKDSINHCQIIDLTDQPEIKKRPAPKSKTKVLYVNPDKSLKLKKESSDPQPQIRVRSKEEITGSSAFSQIIADSLSDRNRFAQNTVMSTTSSTSSVINSTACMNSYNEPVKKISSNHNPGFDYTKIKSNSEGDDIQKVMEGLKELQKMSSPVRTSDQLKTSSPVSVIAFNKSYSHDADKNVMHSSNPVTQRSSSFQDAFQKKFIPDFNLMKASHSSQGTSSSKGTYNSISKHGYLNAKSNPGINDIYLQNPNSSYLQQNSNKVKTNCASQQSGGSYNMLDDMFANFLSEYGHSKAVSSKSNSQHK